MLYDRKIKYLDYYEGGNKVNGGGFIKLEVRENTLRIELTVRGLHPTDSFERDIVLQGAEKEETLGQIRIQNGFGQFRYSCGADQEIGGTGLSYSDLRGIRIPIGGTREILCRWDNTPGKRRIIAPEENTQKIKLVLQEPGKVSLVESYTDNKADSEVSVYAENEQEHEPKPEKTEKSDEIGKESAKEGYESIGDKDKKEESKEDLDRETQGNENREDLNRETQGNENREDLNRETQGNENREGLDRVTQGDENKEGLDRETQGDENKEGLDRETQGDENREDIENKECKEDTKKDIEKIESRERNDERLETGLQSEGQSEGRTKDKPDMVMSNHEEQSDTRKAPVKLMEDKWQQLSAIYPHIQPFRDERDYLSLTPSDFVLFPDRFYRAVNNSFLLHGYYNYHHLILARIERRGETIYYIGVPGNYFEREKQVAIMFGFESFECETEPAKTGDFGYYMMRTEL